MLSAFFIRRPVFAGVVAIAMFIAGLIAIPLLPISQYPDIAPPTVQITATYPGADAQTVVDTVTAPIEQRVNGVEEMIYIDSKSSDNGRATITVTFKPGTDIDMAAVRVQNRVALAEPSLPESVRRLGVSVQKQSTSLLMVLGLVSPDGSYSELELANYASINILDALSRVDGVGGVVLFGGSEFSMRVWLDPVRMAGFDMSPTEVRAALFEQNVQVAAGRVGQQPTPVESGFEYSVSTLGRLSTVEQFEDIIVRTNADGRVVRLKDVARVEFGAQDYDTFSRLNGDPSPAFGVYQLPGSNALEVADGVIAAMDELAASFDEGIEHRISYDFTKFVRASIREVVITILIAALLVFLTVFVFLQDWRATLIPTVAIPVSIVGTMAVLLGLGFSLNMLTLFGLVLAIGIVVDDAIVVVENVARLIDEEGLAPREAALKAMSEITGPVVATTLVLLAVFVPTSMLPGITGSLYRQFGVTISVATILSSINALTLSPALCAILMRTSRERRFFLWRAFDRVLGVGRDGYGWLVGRALRLGIVVLVAYLGVLAATGWLVRITPTGFLPTEDQAVVFANIQLPDAAALGRTDEVLARVEKMAMEIPGVESVIGLGGNSFISGTAQSNTATVIAILEDWDERTDPAESADAIAGRMAMGLMSIQEAVAFPFRPPPIQGLGLAEGFELRIQDRSDSGPLQLQDITQDISMAANGDARLTQVFSPYAARVPKVVVDVDRSRAKRQGLSLDEVYGAMEANLGSVYVNDFNRFGRVYQVRMQADHPYRGDPADVLGLEVRRPDGRTVPMSAIASVRTTVGPSTIGRFNLFPAATVNGRPAPGTSSGDAVGVMDQLLDDRLPRGFGSEWSGITFQQIQAGNLAPIVFGLAVVFVYLVLAAQYESWLTPVSILATVPIGVLGALLAARLRGMPNDVYLQIGLVLLVALASKNAILIVEFAKQQRAEGMSVREAALHAARLRFRPILMTSISFLLGTLPLLIASGAGAASRQALGTAVFGGMVMATVVGVFFIPTMDSIVQSLGRAVRGEKA